MFAYVLDATEEKIAIYKTILSDRLCGRHGLGFLMRDIKWGCLDEMEFLSKNFNTDGYIV